MPIRVDHGPANLLLTGAAELGTAAGRVNNEAADQQIIHNLRQVQLQRDALRNKAVGDSLRRQLNAAKMMQQSRIAQSPRVVASPVFNPNIIPRTPQSLPQVSQSQGYGEVSGGGFRGTVTPDGAISGTQGGVPLDQDTLFRRGGFVQGQHPPQPEAPQQLAKDAYVRSLEEAGHVTGPGAEALRTAAADPGMDLNDLRRAYSTLRTTSPSTEQGKLTDVQKAQLRGVDQNLSDTRGRVRTLEKQLRGMGVDPDGGEAQFETPGEPGWLWDGPSTVDSHGLSLLRAYKQAKANLQNLEAHRGELLGPNPSGGGGDNLSEMSLQELVSQL